MGQITDLKIRSFQEHAGIEPATGDHRARRDEMSKCAHDLIEVLALEKAGIRDGDGYWHGSDPISGIVLQLSDLERERCCEDLECSASVGGQGEPWITDDDSPF